jgi:energy-coupling factor transporter ATP-binding protein EcfA2
MPILGPEQPMPTLAWLRCDPPSPPREPVAGMPEVGLWEAAAGRAYQAARQRTLSGEVSAAAEAVVLQVLAGWEAFDALRHLPRDERDPRLTRKRQDEALIVAARLIGPIPVWLSARRKLAESLITLTAGASPEVGSYVALLFDYDVPELEASQQGGSAWSKAIRALDLYRRRNPRAPAWQELHKCLKAGLPKEAIRRLEPEIGEPPTESSGLEAEHHDVEFSIRRSKRPITLVGPSGSGKTRLAKQIHAWLGGQKPFVHINCHALTPSLVEAELFGTEKGFATGVGENKGAFERAGDGVLFLDEIGDAPPELLGKLLTAIEERQAYRVGGSKPVTFGQFRLVFATQSDLEARVGEGLFRADLMYRMGRMYRLAGLSERSDQDFRQIVRVVFQSVVQELQGERSLVEQPGPSLVAWMYEERQRLFPGEIRSVRNVLEDAVLAAEQRHDTRINRQDIEHAARVGGGRPRATVEPLPPGERLARYQQLLREGTSDNETLRGALGYPATPEGRKSFREWKTRHRNSTGKETEK